MTIRHLLFSVLVLYWLLPYTVSAQNYTVINDASQLPGCNCYQLTPAVNNQGGGVYENNTINLNNSFDYTFNVFLGCNGASGADGIVFILTNNIQGIGAQGGGLGYQGLPGNSLAVEFDTWQNTSAGDPPYDHIAIESQGSVNHNVAGPVSALVSQSNIDNCAWHTAEIVWNVNTQTYSVYFDGVLRLTYTGNIVANFFGGNPVVNWGWSGSTGGGNNDQRFCVKSISNWVAGINYQSCSTTMSFQDISTVNVGTVQSWAWNFGDPGSGASNTSALQNPTHTFSATGTYTVSLIIKDVSGCSDTFSHAVTIAPPITLTPAITQPLCNGGATGSIALTPAGGFGPGAGYGGYMYTWSNAATGSSDIGLTAGTYNVTVNDGVCSATASYNVNQPPALTATTSHTDAPCGGTGTATINISGGTTPYTGVTWDGIAGSPGPSTYTTSGLPVGTVVANFHDANGCSALLTYKEIINSLPCGYTLTTSATNVTCFGGTNGTATLTVTGSIGGVTITWTNSGGANVGSGASIGGLAAGTYTYHYSDASNTFTGTVTINQPGGALVASLTTIGTTCSYLNNGSAVASVTANGTSPYNYNWTPAQPNSPNASGLPPGGVSVTITDANNCTASASGTITGQTVLSASVTTMPDSCFLARKGSATATVTGGNPVYSYLWNNGAIGSTNYGIGAGTYTVTVTDHNNCTSTASQVVGQPTALTDIMAHVNVDCFGNNTGSATVTPSGGNGGYTYVWSNPVTTANNSPLTAGTYYVTVTDSKACTVNDSVTITQPAAFTVTPAHVNVKCKGATTGSITLTLSGGTTTYTVTWSDGPATGPSRTNLAAGTYGYTATDAHNCTVTGSIVITEPASAFTITPAHVDVLCFGNNTGSITLTPAGGTTPYAVPQWLDLATGFNRTNLVAGTYSYADTDANGCLVTGSVIIAQPAAALNVVVAQVNDSCRGDAKGSIALTITGGTTNYTVTWAGGATGTTRSNLVAGAYTYTVTDANNCTSSATVNITQPAAAFTVTPSQVNVKCKGATTGSITLTEAGGTTPYNTVTWSGGATGTSRTNLAAGAYSYTATDAYNCSVTGTINITEPASAFTITPAHVDVLCFGNNTGSITLTPAGGTTPYAVPQWLDLATGFNRTNLVAGTYSYADTDANGCLVTGSVIIAQPAAALNVVVAQVNDSCNGDAKGSITLTITGGTTNYTVTWAGGATGTTRSNLVAGAYTYTVTDANNCTSSATVNITQPAAAFTVTPSQVNVKCKGASTGSITLTEAGGTTPYNTVTWSGGATGTSRTNLAAGAYSYTATDAYNCSVTGTINITEPASAFTITPAHIDVLCFGNNTSSITLTPAGGTTPYAVPQWLDLATGFNRTNLVAGTYSYADTDANGCLVTGSVIIAQPAAALNVAVAQVNDSCNGDAKGSITLTITGGMTNYTVTWAGGATGPTRSNLAAGAYTYTVTDANNCTLSSTVNITEPAAPFTVTPAQVNVKCNGGATGIITLTEAGGTTPYNTVTWSGGATGTSLTNLTAGSYTYTATDAYNCSVTGTINITEPAAPFSITETHVDVVCFGNNTGSITLTPAGGTTPYAQPWWSDLGTGFNRTNLLAGTYTYIDSDANGCLFNGSITITQPAGGGITVNVTETDATCSYNNDGTATASVSTGGVSPFNYAWSNAFTETGVMTSTANGLGANNYSVTVTDQNGCTALGTTTVNSQPKITAQIAVTEVNCFGGTTGAINVTAGGGVGGFSYAWSANAATGNQPNASGLVAANYQLTITDGNNCVLDTFAPVTQPASALTFATPVYVKNVSCNGGNNGEIVYVTSGGTSPYTFTWSGSAAGSPDSAINLTAGSYDVTITDANSCTVINTETVTEPVALSIASQSQTNVSCSGGNNGTATVTIAGGPVGTSYSYAWTPNVGTTNAVSSLAAGAYTVVATDNNQCTISANFNITAPPLLTALAVATDALCHGGATGSVTVTAGGGTPASTGYVYTWNPNVSTTNSDLTLTAGTYAITVTDSLACIATATATVGEPAILAAIVVDTVNVSCSRDSNGQIQLSATGGTTPYQYAISIDGGATYGPSSPSGSFNNLKIGGYTCQVTDAHGCTGIVLTSITAPDSVTVHYTIDTVKCYGESNGAINITATGGTPGYTFAFSNGVINNTGNDQSLSAGTYSFTVTDSRGCAQPYTTDITQPDSLEIFSTPSAPVIDLTETVDLQATSNAATNIVFTWSPSQGLSNTTGSNTTVTTYNTMTYTLTGTINPHGEECVASIPVKVTVIPTYNVYIPNAFTPNGDGINDNFEIFGNKKSFKFVEVEIFDRWGEKVFESTDLDFKWDGRYNGTLLEPGVYIYQLSIVFVNNHSEAGYKGSITLLR